FPGLFHSGAARAAVENMTRGLSVEWARYGIVVSAIAAGHFDTEVLHTKYPEVVGRSAAKWPPLGRLGKADEFAWLVAYLASPAGD
ncbi:SDR family oxidoreductase, partial [Acinetobacter baumannii]